MRLKILLSTILFFALASCIHYTVGWQSTNPPGEYKASFKYFRGKETNSINVSKGHLLLVSYDIEVIQGSLLVAIKKGRNKLWQKQFSGQRDMAEFELAAAETGVYKIVIEGKNAVGSFDINYKNAAPFNK